MVSQDTMMSLVRALDTTVEAREEARESTTAMRVRGSAHGAMAAGTMPRSGKKQ